MKFVYTKITLLWLSPSWPPFRTCLDVYAVTPEAQTQENLPVHMKTSVGPSGRANASFIGLDFWPCAVPVLVTCRMQSNSNGNFSREFCHSEVHYTKYRESMIGYRGWEPPSLVNAVDLCLRSGNGRIHHVP